MLFSNAALVVVLAGSSFAAPVPQIGGEAQFCQKLLDGISNGVGGGASAALNNVAGSVGTAKATVPAGKMLKYRHLDRRQLTGTAAACYDLINNIDQGSGYATGNLLDGIAGDEGAECTDGCSVQNSGKRQVGDIAGGLQAVSNAVGTGAVTTGLTTGAGNIADSLSNAQSGLGSEAGTIEAEVPSDTAALIGNEVGTVIHARQLNKISAGEQNLANSVGLGGLVAPTVTAENSLDTVGTDQVGDLGQTLGDLADGTLTAAGQSVP